MPTTRSATAPRAGQILTGPLFDEPMRVETVASAGPAGWSLGLVGTRSKRFRKVTLGADDLTVRDGGFRYDGDGGRLRLGLQAHVLGIAWEFDPNFALSVSRVDPLPHQLEAVYDHLLKPARVRFLLADDAGAGKTIMAGLLIRELRLRGLAERILIVAPSNLAFQWQRELREKFDETFVVLRGGDLRAQFGVNQWMRQPKAVTSLDLAKEKRLLSAMLPMDETTPVQPCAIVYVSVHCAGWHDACRQSTHDRRGSYRPVAVRHELIGIDLFAGAGGMSLGAKAAGIDVQLAVESDPYAAQTYAANHRTTSLFASDIRTLNSTDLAPWKALADRLVVFGGPPCQGFSWSNLRTRNAANEKNWLFREFLRVVRLLNPAWVVFENVQGIVDTSGGIFLDQVKKSLEQNYELHSALLNAMHYGVPQSRTRYFLVCTRDGDHFYFPSRTRKTPLTVDEAIRDLPRLLNGHNVSRLPYGLVSPSSYGRAMRGVNHSCQNHIVTRNTPLVISRYRYVPPGGNWENIPANLMTSYRDRTRCHTGLYRRLRPDQPSIVISNYRKNMLIHPRADRGLSVREAARLQSFPDSFELKGSIGFQQQQIGNAVPPLLARAVFRQVSRCFQSRQT